MDNIIYDSFFLIIITIIEACFEIKKLQQGQHFCMPTNFREGVIIIPLENHEWKWTMVACTIDQNLDLVGYSYW
jgi:hypothetical protein